VIDWWLSPKTPVDIGFFGFFGTVSAFWTIWIGLIGFIGTVSAF